MTSLFDFTLKAGDQIKCYYKKCKKITSADRIVTKVGPSGDGWSCETDYLIMDCGHEIPMNVIAREKLNLSHNKRVEERGK